MADKTKHPLEAIKGAIKIRDGNKRHPLYPFQDIEGAILVKAAPKESAEDMRDRLIAEMRDRQETRTPPYSP